MKNLITTVMFFLIASFAIAQGSLDSGLVAFYPFNGNANDESGNSHNGTVSGATITTDRFNKSERAYNFVYNGFSSDRIEVSGTSDLNFSSGGFSISAWVEFSGPAASGNNYPIFSKHICGEQSGYILMLYNGKLTFWLAGSGGYNILSTPDDYTDNSWHQVIAVYDGVTQAIYVDGLLKNSISFNYDTFNSANWALGGYNGCNGGFNGKVDEIKVLKRALSVSEVQDMYNQSANHLVAFYPFNGNANDVSGNGHDGTVNGNTALTTDRFNSENKAFTFPDQSSNISLTNSTNMNLESGFTFNAWVKYKNTYSVIIGKHVCGYVNGLVLGIDYDGQFQLWLGNSGWSTVRTNKTLIENRWYMVTATYDGSSGSAKIYLDGQLENSVTISYTNFSPYPISIGEAFQNNCQPANMSGAIDEVKIFNRPLSDIEIQNEYNLTYKGLVAFYPFNGNVNDESGNGNNSTYIGVGVTLATDRFGNADRAYYFDGNDGSYIRIPADNFPTTDRTISFWFYAEQLDNHPTPLSYGGDVCYNSVLMIINKGDYPNAYTVLSHCASNFISAPYSEPPINNWYNLTMTISGVTQKIFINGELQQTENTFSTPTFVAGKSAIFGAILYTDGNTVYDEPTAGEFQGKLDDFRFYDYAFSDAQVLQLYNDESAGLVASYPFNGNTNDESGNGNDGINHNGIFSKDRYGNDNASMLFTGIDSYVEGTNPGNNLPTGNSPRTIAAWIKENSFHPWGNNIFHYGLDQSAPTNFHLYTTDVIRIGNGYDYGVVFGTTTIVDSTWHFVAGVYEGGTEHIAKVYVDGKLDAAGILSTEPNTILGSNWKIGRFITGSTNFDGDIDELKIYNFALTDQEIFDLYKATTTSPNLSLPQNNSAINTLTPLLDWDSSVVATSYRLLLSNDSTFQTNLLDEKFTRSFHSISSGILQSNTKYFWKVRTINDGGIGPWSEVYNFSTLLTDVENKQQIPTKFALLQNYPNPFNPSTKIRWQSPVSSWQTLKVFDVLGNEVATLVNEYKSAGSYEVDFNAANESLRASGVYFYQLKAGSYIQTKKMILVR